VCFVFIVWFIEEGFVQWRVVLILLPVFYSTVVRFLLLQLQDFSP
jgi:hypothetical protein